MPSVTKSPFPEQNLAELAALRVAMEGWLMGFPEGAAPPEFVKLGKDLAHAEFRLQNPKLYRKHGAARKKSALELGWKGWRQRRAHERATAHLVKVWHEARSLPASPVKEHTS